MFPQAEDPLEVGGGAWNTPFLSAFTEGACRMCDNRLCALSHQVHGTVTAATDSTAGNVASMFWRRNRGSTEMDHSRLTADRMQSRA